MVVLVARAPNLIVQIFGARKNHATSLVKLCPGPKEGVAASDFVGLAQHHAGRDFAASWDLGIDHCFAGWTIETGPSPIEKMVKTPWVSAEDFAKKSTVH